MLVVLLGTNGVFYSDALMRCYSLKDGPRRTSTDTYVTHLENQGLEDSLTAFIVSAKFSTCCSSRVTRLV